MLQDIIVLFFYTLIISEVFFLTFKFYNDGNEIRKLKEENLLLKIKIEEKMKNIDLRMSETVFFN